jgi:hypothetical protein
MSFSSLHFRLAALVGLCVLFATGTPAVKAGPVTTVGGLYENPGPTQFKLTDFEILLDHNGNVVTDPNHVIVVGDQLFGILNITSTQTTAGTNINTPSGFQLTGIFDTQIAATHDNGDGTSQFAFIPSTEPILGTPGGLAGFLATLPNVIAAGGTAANLAGSMNALFVQNGTPFTSDGTLASTIASADGGTFYLAEGSTGVWGTNYYWTATGANTVAGAAFLSTTFTATMGVIFNNTGLTFKPDQHTVSVTNTGLPAPYNASLATLAGIMNQVSLKGSVTPNSPDFGTGASPYPLSSQDPSQLDPALTPEPGTMLIWSVLGGLGCIVNRMRRRKPGRPTDVA